MSRKKICFFKFFDNSICGNDVINGNYCYFHTRRNAICVGRPKIKINNNGIYIIIPDIPLSN